ncbi:DUF4139 domain-containing protein [bacterium]|nr:DUF4139 domain-containing protein [bacterium]
MFNRNVIICFILLALQMGYPGAQDNVAITIYNQNLGLVKEIREIEFKKGAQKLVFTEIPSRIEPRSVHFRSLDNKDMIILEQNYEYDLVGTSKLLEKYIDHEISLNTNKDKHFDGRLLSADNNSILLASPGGNLFSINREEILNLEFPSLPEGLITKPTLVWELQSSSGGKGKVEVSYLTEGINWSADYVGVVDRDDRGLGLEAWVTITNNSGGSYHDATLKLVAGDINRVVERRLDRGMDYSAAQEKTAMPDMFQEETFFEYHLYTLSRPSDIKENEIKQISLFAPADVKVQKLFIYEPNLNAEKVMSKLEFKNSTEEGLGMPLPEGVVRVYKEDREGALQFVGEDRIKHTPRDEKVRLFLGYAFDLTAERVRKNYNRLSNDKTESTYQIKLRNHKDEQVEVLIVENFYGDWFIRESTHQWDKKEAFKAETVVTIPPKGETIIEYTILNQN